jgi:hypothetical protein
MTYAVQESATVFLEEDLDEALIQISHLIRLIGERKTYLILYKWPDGQPTSEYVEPDDFLQVTGTQQGLTVELRHAGRLSTLGHKSGDTRPVQIARKDGGTIEVNENEVLSPDEAVALFTEYRVTDAIDVSKWNLRQITAPTADSQASGGSAAPGSGAGEAPPVAEPQKQASKQSFSIRTGGQPASEDS